jgi:hypothetical protein
MAEQTQAPAQNNRKRKIIEVKVSMEVQVDTDTHTRFTAERCMQISSCMKQAMKAGIQEGFAKAKTVMGTDMQETGAHMTSYVTESTWGRDEK